MELGYKFEEYIEYLREHLVNLVDYQEQTGRLQPNILELKEALFDDDPFVVFNASLAASVLLADQTLYH